MPTKTLDNVVLSELVELALGATAEHVSLSPGLAKKIEESDYDSALVHIEWPSSVNRLKHPRMWRIQAWRASLERDQYIKENSAKSRAVWTRVSELREHLIRKLWIHASIERDLAEPIVSIAIKQRNKDVFKVYGIDITELLEADAQLNEFKQRHEYSRKTEA
jgi:hypothetical protein